MLLTILNVSFPIGLRKKNIGKSNLMKTFSARKVKRKVKSDSFFLFFYFDLRWNVKTFPIKENDKRNKLSIIKTDTTKNSIRVWLC